MKKDNNPKKVLVAEGAGLGNKQEYIDAAREVARLLASKGYGYVQGGCARGLMGETLDEFLKYSNDVTIVIPRCYASDLKGMKYKKAYKVKTIQDRLTKFMELSHIAIALPGALGTLHEISTYIETYRGNEQPIKMIVVNINGYYDNLFAQIERMITDGLLKRSKLTKYMTIVNSVKEIDKLL